MASLCYCPSVLTERTTVHMLAALLVDVESRDSTRTQSREGGGLRVLVSGEWLNSLLRSPKVSNLEHKKRRETPSFHFWHTLQNVSI